MRDATPAFECVYHCMHQRMGMRRYGERAIKGRALAVLNDNGMGVAMFALGPSELMEHYEGILGSIADSLSFMPEE